MSRILIVYSSTDGHTIKICGRLAEWLKAKGDDVDVMSVQSTSAEDLKSADKLVIGASIRYGHHNKMVYDFVARYGELLDARPNAFFSVNVVARKPNRNTPETNPYLKRFLSQISWVPQNLAVFAGKIDYPRYNLFDRSIIRLIMFITKGPTDPQAVVEFTNWSKVEAFSARVHEM